MNHNYQVLRDTLTTFTVQVLSQVCSSLAGIPNDDDEWKQIQDAVFSSISFPNKNPSSPEGKPHNVEIRVALSLFHRWKRKQSSNSVVVVSDLGLKREISSPRAFAEVLLIPLEDLCQKDGIAHDIRVQASGIICIVTAGRSQLLRESGRLPCPRCIQWCKGVKGLWWHQQQNHKIEHSEATASASASMDELALIPFIPNSTTISSIIAASSTKCNTQPSVDMDDPLEFVKNGDLDSLKQAVKNGYSPAKSLDRRGASPLMWAAGGGHLDIVRFLVENCDCDPSQGQRGKRSFSGRTALHWAARNGHFDVVEYLVSGRQVNLEAATIDGTTAFGWACWQGHLQIMEFLCEKGCDIDRRNSFGCNAVLWCAQGYGDVAKMKWLESKGCTLTIVNNNGHGVAHKAAQRGQEDLCRWFFDEIIFASEPKTSLKLVGPDTEGYCASDLAGMEGYENLAKYLASKEMDLIERLDLSSNTGDNIDGIADKDEAVWLYESVSDNRLFVSKHELCIWEKFGGVRRMRSKLKAS